MRMILSIRPEYAEAILAGRKKYEFRKRKCRSDINTIIFYATAPKSAIVGEAKIEWILEASPDIAWKETERWAGISHEKFKEYYRETKKAVVYKLKDVVAYDPLKKLSDYGVERVPQSWVYVD